MASSHLLRLGTIKGKNGILEALRHNKRTLQNERGATGNIDATRTSLNYSLASADTPETIAKHAKVQMVEAGIDTPRKNQVMAVEVLFSLPIDRHQQNTKPFFADCHKWVLKTFPGELLSFDIHLDESAPHAHAVILPLIDGKMQGNGVIGGRGNLMRLIKLFHLEVARHYGLSRSENKRLNQAGTSKQ
ncbi:MAG: plasmid recombination protein [Pseudomonadota bacterium]